MVCHLDIGILENPPSQTQAYGSSLHALFGQVYQEMPIRGHMSPQVYIKERIPSTGETRDNSFDGASAAGAHLICVGEQLHDRV